MKTIKIGRFGEELPWLPTVNPNQKKRLHDPEKNIKNKVSLVQIKKNRDGFLEFSVGPEQPGWIRTWSEYNHYILQEKPAKLPCWHVLESSVGMAGIPTLAQWENKENAGLSILEKWSIHSGNGSPDSQWINLLRHWTAKRMAHKNGWDRAFFMTMAEPVREVFALTSQTNADTILAFDTNGAFSWAVANIKVPDPSMLNEVKGKQAKDAWEDDTLAGVFRVNVTTTSKTPSWFKKYHPAVCRVGKQNRPVIWPDTPVEMFLHKCEKKVWESIVDVKVIDGVVAPARQHPLAATAKTLWSQRLTAVSVVDKSWVKWLLSRLHTACVPARYQTVSDIDSANWFKLLGCEPFGDPGIIQDIDHPSAVWSSAATVLAWSRAHWLEMLTAVMKTCPTATLAYSNVDSLHLIIPTTVASEFMEKMEETNLYGDGWGQWRLQAKADSAVWLGLGKYWLVSNGKLLFHQNLGSTNPWATGRRWLRPCVDLNGKHPTVEAVSQTIWQTLTSHAYLVKDRKGVWLYKRPTIELVRNEDAYSTHLMKETLRSHQKKKKLWYLLKNTILKK